MVIVASAVTPDAASGQASVSDPAWFRLMK
jgi:hypothetical protein